MSKLFCKYCKRFCDERCLHCAYMKEAELKEEEEKDDEKEDEEIKERQSSRSRGASDTSDNLRGLLSSADTYELITVDGYVIDELIRREGLEFYVRNCFTNIYTNSTSWDSTAFHNLEEKVINLIKGGKEVV